MELETSVSMSSDNYDTEGFSAQPPWVSTVYNRYQAPCSGRICAESMVLLHYFLFDQGQRITLCFFRVYILWIWLLFLTVKVSCLCQLKGLVKARKKSLLRNAKSQPDDHQCIFKVCDSFTASPQCRRGGGFSLIFDKNRLFKKRDLNQILLKDRFYHVNCTKKGVCFLPCLKTGGGHATNIMTLSWDPRLELS